MGTNTLEVRLIENHIDGNYKELPALGTQVVCLQSILFFFK